MLWNRKVLKQGSRLCVKKTFWFTGNTEVDEKVTLDQPCPTEIRLKAKFYWAVIEKPQTYSLE